MTTIDIRGIPSTVTAEQLRACLDALAGTGTPEEPPQETPVSAPMIGRAIRGLLPANNPTTPASRINIAPGAARVAGMTKDIVLSSGIVKTTGGWAPGDGNGGLDTGIVAPNKGYHLHLIYNPTIDVTDVLMSLSYASPLLPDGYTQFIPFNGFVTDGSGNIRPGIWYANGDFRFNDAYVVVNGAAGNLLTLKQFVIPLGLKMQIRGQAFGSGTGAPAFWIIVRDPDLGTIVDDADQWYEAQVYVVSGQNYGGRFDSWTDASGQIYYVTYQSGSGRVATNLVYLYFQGWTYPRDDFA